jgi:hypothetical protein
LSHAPNVGQVSQKDPNVPSVHLKKENKLIL